MLSIEFIFFWVEYDCVVQVCDLNVHSPAHRVDASV